MDWDPPARVFTTPGYLPLADAVDAAAARVATNEQQNSVTNVAAAPELRRHPFPYDIGRVMAERNRVRAAAWELILGALRKGTLEACLQDMERLVRTIPAEAWLTSGAIFSPPNKVELPPRSDKHFTVELMTKHGLVLGKILISERSFSSFLEDTLAPDRTLNRGRPGREPKYDNDEFLIEIFRVIYEGRPFPKNKKDLVDRACRAYERARLKSGRPEYEWARKKVRKVWTGLQLRPDDN
jgi:hypothetical protein